MSSSPILFAGARSTAFEFVTGPAGTGKTFEMRRRAMLEPTRLTATTGIAAVNVGDATVTINSLLRYFDTASLQEAAKSGEIVRRLRALARGGVRRVVIDEVSMLGAPALGVLVRAFEKVREDDRIALTLTGDFCQLPPVKEDFAFEAPEWDRFEESTTRLERMYRQTEPEFLDALGAARRGDGEAALPNVWDRFELALDRDFSGTTLFSTNSEVDRFNAERLARLATPWHRFYAERWGEARPEWKNIPDELALRPGATVMVLANRPTKDRESFEYVNGDLGEFVGHVSVDGVSGPGVLLRRKNEVVVVSKVERDNAVPVDAVRQSWLFKHAPHRLRPAPWLDRADLPPVDSQTMKAVETWTWEALGGITYLPLRVAYASTVHKSQGLTLDAVQIDLGHQFLRTPGMLYVALSRVRSLEGLRMVGDARLFVSRCRVNRKVMGWI